MIFRRITEHLKNQNWFAVFIEFLIVVFGVFIGLQVENLNDNRKERLEEKLIIQRLITDLDVDKINIDRAIRIISNKESALVEVYSALTSPYSDITEPDIFLKNVLTGALYGWNQYSLQRSTYDELLGGGKFSLISDASLRLAISNYYLNDRTKHDRINERETEYPGTTYLLIPRSNEFNLYEELDKAEMVKIAKNVYESISVNQVMGELNLARFLQLMYAGEATEGEIEPPYQGSNILMLERLNEYLKTL